MAGFFDNARRVTPQSLPKILRLQHLESFAEKLNSMAETPDPSDLFPNKSLFGSGAFSELFIDIHPPHPPQWPYWQVLITKGDLGGCLLPFSIELMKDLTDKAICRLRLEVDQ
jgi:hypothetical protein